MVGVGTDNIKEQKAGLDTLRQTLGPDVPEKRLCVSSAEQAGRIKACCFCSMLSPT